MTNESEAVTGPMRNPSHPGDLVRHDSSSPWASPSPRPRRFWACRARRSTTW